MEGKPAIQIPQDLTRFEDKILGPFTMTQSLILAGGALVIFMLVGSGLPLPLIVALSVIVGLVALIAAVVRVDEVPIYEWLMWQMEFRLKPRQRIWRREIQDEPETKPERRRG